MRVCVVGAGITGLTAARALTLEGHEVLIYEKSDHVGGRCETRQIGPYTFDPGATGLTPRGGPMEPVILKELDASELVRIEKPIYTHSALRVSPGDPAKNAMARYTYRTGNGTLPKLMSEGLDVRLDTRIETIETVDGGYRVLGESFDSVILTPPVPQTSTILWSLGESRPFANAKYRPCLSVMLGFERELPSVPYHALLDPEQRHPLLWLSLESVKSPGRAPEGCSAMVVQFSSSYSLSHFNDEEERVVGDALDYVGFLYGEGWAKPAVSGLRRYKYSLPDSTALFDAVNTPGSSLIVAGDGVLAGRVEGAFACGLRAAALLLEGGSELQAVGSRT